MTLEPRKSPAVFSTIFAGFTLLVVAISIPVSTPGTDFIYTLALVPRVVAREIEVGIPIMDVIRDNRRALFTALIGYASGGIVGRLVFLWLSERRTPKQAGNANGKE
jgi:hypothetical protein